MKNLLLILSLFLLNLMYSFAQTCQWAEGIGGKSNVLATSIAIDDSGNVYVAGRFDSDSVSFNNGVSLINTNRGFGDAYLVNIITMVFANGLKKFQELILMKL